MCEDSCTNSAVAHMLATLDKWGVDVETYEFVREHARRVLQTL